MVKAPCITIRNTSYTIISIKCLYNKGCKAVLTVCCKPLTPRYDKNNASFGTFFFEISRWNKDREIKLNTSKKNSAVLTKNSDANKYANAPGLGYLMDGIELSEKKNRDNKIKCTSLQVSKYEADSRTQHYR